MLARERRVHSLRQGSSRTDILRCAICTETDPEALVIPLHHNGGHQEDAIRERHCANDHNRTRVHQAQYQLLLSLLKHPKCPWLVRRAVWNFDQVVALELRADMTERHAFDQEEREGPGPETEQMKQDAKALRALARHYRARGQALIDRFGRTPAGRRLLRHSRSKEALQ